MAQHVEEGRDALIAALRSIGVKTSEVANTPDRGPDLRVSVPNGLTIDVRIESVATADLSLTERLVTSGAARTTVIVAGRIPKASRLALSGSGFSWFDRRGHLRLSGPGIFIDTDTEPFEGLVQTRNDGVRGRAGIAYATELLLFPRKPPAIREVARRAGMSPSTISEAAKSLRAAALVDADGPLLPDLFWALAEQWTPRFVHLGGRSRSDLSAEFVRLGIFGDEAEPGWAVTGAVGAAAWVAPLAVRSDTPPEFYVPSVRTLSLARNALGDGSMEDRSCSVAVAPTPAACCPRMYLRSSEPGHFLFTRPLFVALELANDPVRGREILNDWTPGYGSRVW